MSIPPICGDLLDCAGLCWVPLTVSAGSALLRMHKIAYTILGIAAGMFSGLLVNKLAERYDIPLFKTLIKRALKKGKPFENHRVPLFFATLAVGIASPNIGSVVGVFFGYFGIIGFETNRKRLEGQNPPTVSKISNTLPGTL